MLPAAFNINSDLFISTLDLARPLWATRLYQPYDQIDIKEMNLLLAKSPKETVGNITGVHYELDRPTTYFQAGALFTVAGAQNTQTGPLAAALVNSDGTSAVRIGDVLIDQVTMVRFRVDAKSTANPPVVELTPLNIGFSTPIPSGRNLAYATRAEKERSSAPDQIVRGTTAYTWYTQITRGTTNLSGTAENIGLKPAVLADGTTLNGWNTVQTMDTEAQMLREMFGAFMFGDNTDGAQADLTIQLSTTQGLDSVVASRGWNMNIGSTAITYANLQTATNNIKAQGGTEFYQVWAGAKRVSEWNTVLTAQQANSMNPAMDKVMTELFFGSNANHEALRATYSWSTVTINGITFGMKELAFLNNPTTYNVDPTTSAFQNLMYFIPMVNGSMKITTEGGKTISSDYVTVMNRSMYKDRWMLMRSRGLTSTGANDGVDQNIVDSLVDFGYRFVCMNQFGRIY